MFVRSLVWLALLGAAPLAALYAQAPVLRLRPAIDSLDHEFTRLGSVRELSDGRVLVTDAGERQLLLVHFGSGEVLQIGRVGAGPGEYEGLGVLIPLGGDTTLFSDQSNGRFALVHEARIVSTIPADNAFYTRIGPQLIGASHAGRFLASRASFPPNAGSRYRLADAAVSASRGGGRADTVAVLRGTEMALTSAGPPGSGAMRSMSVIFSTSEQATIFPDGWIAVALQDPYRVDWYPPSGAVQRGAAIDREHPAVTEAEKDAWMSAAAAASGRPFSMPKDQLAWAERIAPYRFGALVPLPDGRLLVAKLAWTGSPDPHYDIIDRRGLRVGVLHLRKDEQVVGAGARGLYVGAADEDGIVRLRVHPVP